MKQVTVYSTSLGTESKIFSTNARTFGELINDLSSNGIEYNSGNMKAILGTRVTLESREAQLPEGNFQLFLLPKKTKSGRITIYDNYENLSDLERRQLDKILEKTDVLTIANEMDIEICEMEEETEKVEIPLASPLKNIMEDEELCC